MVKFLVKLSNIESDNQEKVAKFELGFEILLVEQVYIYIYIG